MIKRMYFLFLITIISIPGMTQTRFPVVLVNTGTGSYINEPAVCINPKNTSQIAGGSVLNNFYYSSNRGVTWNGGVLSTTYGGVWGDPALTVDTNNNFYYIHLNSGSGSGWWLDRIVCQKSTDGGQTWSNGTYFGMNSPKQQDKCWPVVNRANNHIYATWTQFDSYGTSNPSDSSIILFTKSVDQGATWSSPLRLSRRAGDCVDGSNTDEGAVPCVGPNGQIYVSWAGPVGLMFNRSLDDGNTWVNANIFVDSMPGGWNISIPGIDRSNGMPVCCCDLSNGPYRGTVYINWADIRNGSNDADIWFRKSTDQGNTWSARKRVNDDPPGKEQFLTWMTVDNVTGYIYIVFNDRRNYSDNETDIYLAVSTDGGQNFVNIKLDQNPFTPSSSIFFGDYTNISAYNNIVRPVWEDENGSSDTKTIYMALIDSIYTNPITWSGGTSTDWNNPWNWTPWSVPTGNQDVVIPQVAAARYYPNVNIAGLSCNNLTINANASVTVPASMTFEVKGNLTILNGGTLTNNGTITLRGNLINQNTP
ncbi:MAG: sialidase family protein [Bacteroidales bacterium]